MMAGMSGDGVGLTPVLLLWLGWQCSTLLSWITTEYSLAAHLVLPPQGTRVTLPSNEFVMVNFMYHLD